MHSQYTSLDSLRGIAALIVVIHHCTRVLFGFTFPAWIIYSPLRIIVSGKGSVLVFFALSGFVLYLTVTRSTTFHYRQYIIKRFFRLFPPFIVAVFISAILYWVVQPRNIPELGSFINFYSWNSPPSLSLIVGHLLMTDNEHFQSLDNVMWSLVHEVRISIIFPIIAFAISKRWFYAAAIAFILSMTSQHLAQHFGQDWLFNPLLTLQYVFLFAGGAAVAHNAKSACSWLSGTIWQVRVILWTIALIAITFSMNPNIGFIANLAALLLVTLCFADPNVKIVLARSPMVWLGRVSYSLYLIHLPILLTLVHLFYGVVPLPVILLSTITLSLGFAEILYRIIEEPSMKLGRKFATSLSNDRTFSHPLENTP